MLTRFERSESQQMFPRVILDTGTHTAPGLVRSIIDDVEEVHMKQVQLQRRKKAKLIVLNAHDMASYLFTRERKMRILARYLTSHPQDDHLFLTKFLLFNPQAVQGSHQVGLQTSRRLGVRQRGCSINDHAQTE